MRNIEIKIISKQKKSQAMKRLYMMIAAMAMLPLMAVAQTDINKIWSRVESGGLGTQNEVQMERANDADGKPWSFSYYGLLLKSGSAEFKQLRSAFIADRKDAYSVFVKNARQKNGMNTTLKIGYADDTKTIEFGTISSHNYEVLLFRDSKDSLRRTAYALVWFDADDSDYTQCYVYRIYGRDPQRMKKMRNQSVTIQSDGTIIKYDGTTNNSVVLRPQDDSLSGKSVKIENVTDFLVRFNKLRADYTQALDFAGKDQAFYADKIMQPVNELLLLCRNYSRLLSDKERTACGNILVDMQNQSRDTGVKQMLDLSRKYVLGL